MSKIESEIKKGWGDLLPEEVSEPNDELLLDGTGLQIFPLGTIIGMSLAGYVRWLPHMIGQQYVMSLQGPLPLLPSSMVTDGESGGDFGGYRSQSALDRSQGPRGSEFSNGASQKISSHQERELMAKLDRLEARLDADEDEFVSGMA